MNRKTILANAMVLVVALAGCEGMDSPTAPVEIQRGAGTGTPLKDLTGELTIVSSTVAGWEELAMSYSSTAPAGAEVAPAESLTVVVTDLLATDASLSVSPSYSVSGTTSTIQDGEPVKVSGKSRVKTAKVTYSDGTSGWEQEITTTAFAMKGQNSGADCKSQEDFRFDGKFDPGATVLQQRARSMVVCPGEGRVYFVHLNIQTVFTPSGQANSHVHTTCVSRSEEYPCA